MLINYFLANIRNLLVKEFNDWSVMGSGRWIKVQHKNPNEQDRGDLIQELEQLPDKLRNEVSFLLF